jgi:RNA polymerase sigma-70 factor (ECF subfamily)
LSKKITDKEILKLLKQNEPKAISCIIEIYGAGIMKRALVYLKDKETAEDICQEVYISIWSKRKQLTISSSLSGYLSTIVKNKCLNYIKSNSRVRIEDDSSLQNQKSAYTDSHSQLEASEMTLHIMDLVSQLPEKCRIVFEMSRFDHLSNAEIAERTGKSIKTVENQMSRALRELKEKMTDAYPHLNLIRTNVALITFGLLGIGGMMNNTVL